MRRIGTACLTLLFLLLTACTDSIPYHSYHHFTTQEWNKNDTVILHLAVTDSFPNRYEILFLVRNQSTYPYQDLAVTLWYNLPDSLSWKSRELNLMLADKDGKWFGSGLGGLYQFSLSLDDVQISHPCNPTFKVIHRMQDDYLHGINDIGILLKKKEE